MRQRSNKTAQGKAQATGFYQPRHNASRSFSLSGDGRRRVLTKRFLDYQDVVAPEELSTPPQPSTSSAATAPTASTTSGSYISSDPALHDDAPAAELVPGVNGVAVVTKKCAKRYVNSVCSLSA